MARGLQAFWVPFTEGMQPAAKKRSCGFYEVTEICARARIGRIGGIVLILFCSLVYRVVISKVTVGTRAERKLGWFAIFISSGQGDYAQLVTHDLQFRSPQWCKLCFCSPTVLPATTRAHILVVKEVLSLFSEVSFPPRWFYLPI